MTDVNDAQRKAAKAVGFCYLFAMAAGVFGESFVRGKLIVAGNAAETARNIMAHELLFRLGIGSEILSFVSDIVLITALYVILERVNRPIALLAALFRIVATSICVAMTLTSLNVLRVLSLPDLASVFVNAHRDAFNVAFIFLGLGSTVFCYLWFQSRYIPRALAGLGIIGSFMLAAGCFAIVIFPFLYKTLGLTFMMPLGIFEISMGFWLLFRPLR